MKIRKEIKIGFILLFTLAFFIWGYSFIKGKNILKPAATYYVIYEKVGGLQESAPVIVNGVKIGLVEDVRFMPDFRNIRVTLLLNRNYRVPLNSVAKIYSSDIMGTKSIELVLSSSTQYHLSGDTLKAEIEPDLKEEINLQLVPLKLKAEELMGSIDSILVIIQTVFNENFQENFMNSFDNISKAVGSLERSMHAIDTILTDENSKFSLIMNNLESITANFKNNNKEITQIFSNLSTITDSLAKADIQTTITNLNVSLAKTNEILDKINKGEGSAGALLNDPALYENLAKASASLDRLLIDFRNDPRRYVSVSLINFGKGTKKSNSDTIQTKK
jgi:phospholipid/cholesterol/gamma-HCH transport system substrate-binding protein